MAFLSENSREHLNDKNCEAWKNKKIRINYAIEQSNKLAKGRKKLLRLSHS